MKYLTLVILLCVATLDWGCKKSVLNENPPNIIAAETLFKNYDGFEAGLNGLYSLVRSDMDGLNGGTSLVADMFMNGTDNLTTNHYVAGINTIFQDWGTINNASNSFYSDVFGWLYTIVNTSNTIIARAANPAVDWAGGNASAADNRNRVIAEARAVRAWAYRHLSFSWGDVPLNLQEGLGSNIRTDWERTPMAVVRRQIITDLSEAVSFIPVEASQPGRMTRGAAQHYLAEMYLTIDKPDSALLWADKVINTPEYKLITGRYGVNSTKPGVAFMDMFYPGNINRKEGNTEALWVFQFQEQTIGGGANLMKRHHVSRYASIKVGTATPFKVTVERGGNGLGRMSLTKRAIDLYDALDDRGSGYAIRKYFILTDATGNAPAAADVLPAGYKYGDTIKLSWATDISVASRGRVDWPYSRKEDWANPNNLADYTSYKNGLYLRLADTYLLKAEAQFKLGMADDAATTINALRSRAHASLFKAADISLDLILDERSRELVLEEDRRYTLLRTHKWLERVRLYNHNGGQLVQNRDTLFPHTANGDRCESDESDGAEWRVLIN